MSRSLTSGLGPKGDLTAPKSNFRSTPESGLKSDIRPCPKSAPAGDPREASDVLSGIKVIGSLFSGGRGVLGSLFSGI